jgi:hypothetical protein
MIRPRRQCRNASMSSLGFFGRFAERKNSLFDKSFQACRPSGGCVPPFIDIQGARTFLKPVALAALINRWPNVTKASQSSARPRCKASAKSRPCVVRSSAVATRAGSSSDTRGSPAKARNAAQTCAESLTSMLMERLMCCSKNGGTVADWIMQNGQYQSGNVITTARHRRQLRKAP